jgi:hypothetical protein
MKRQLTPTISARRRNIEKLDAYRPKAAAESSKVVGIAGKKQVSKKREKML